MNSDPGSLDNLQDIVVPEPVPWWPPAPGWWVILILLATLLLIAAWKVWKRWKANAYRRAALAELRGAASTLQIARLLKRTAIVGFDRVEVAALTGRDWTNWLERSSGLSVPDAVAETLERNLFVEETGPPSAALCVFAEHWIRKHEVPKRC